MRASGGRVPHSSGSRQESSTDGFCKHLSMGKEVLVESFKAFGHNAFAIHHSSSS